MRQYFRILLALAFALFCRIGMGQSACPPNIGFESGTFQGWKCFAGQIDGLGTISGTTVAPIPGRHTILQNSIPQQLDQYGNFPVNCPNGSGYSIKLGNASTGMQVDRVSYTFSVPVGQNEFSIIYNYAIVFQDPAHASYEQPRFTSRVFDETESVYLECGSFEFVATSSLPGFAPGSVPNVWYKPWSPVTIKLMNCGGKTITLEFTVNDCTRGGHFGYAYLDVNENCGSPITGNVYCNGNTSLTLGAPFGFQGYKWMTADFSTVLGTSNILHLAPIPPVGTVLALEITPYPGLGCLDTLYTTIQLSPDGFHFEALDSVIGCFSNPVNLTAPGVTQGSSPGLSFSYFLDSTLLQYISIPSQVVSAGTYYIKAVNSVGCNEVQPVSVVFRNINLFIKPPAEQCFPNTVNLTETSVTAGSDAGLSYTYWKNSTATDPVSDPAAIPVTGQYYIKAENSQCGVVAPVHVTIWTPDNLKTNPFSKCLSVDLAEPAITQGSSGIFNTFTYWQDTLGTIPLASSKNITTSGTYYIKGITTSGCYFIKPATITVKPGPDFAITDPPVVTAPATVNILNVASGIQNYQYSFWLDDKGTKELTDPALIRKTGIYYVKALDTAGCAVFKPVNVTVLIPYHPVIKYPNAFSPNKDGVNDRFRIEVVGNITYNFLRVFDRWGRVVFETKDPYEYWYGDQKGKPLPVGTYYWIMELTNNNNRDFYRRTGTITLLR